MTRDEYLEQMQNRPDWKPGWEAISDHFTLLYGENAFQYVDAASLFGGYEHIDGFGVVASPKGYMHIVTSGLTNIRANEDAFGNIVSGWGYEITVKWPGSSIDDCLDAFKLLSRLAAYAQVKKVRWYNYQAFSLSRLRPVPEIRTDSFAGVLFTEDTLLPAIDTVNGRVEFLQIVNVTAAEMKRLRSYRHLTRQLAFNLSKENPDLQMALTRTTDCLTD